MTTADAAVAALAAHGIDTIYALPGVHNDDFFDALAKQTAEHRSAPCITRHEQGAAYMALGAALATGESRRPIASSRARACSTPRPHCSPPTA